MKKTLLALALLSFSGMVAGLVLDPYSGWKNDLLTSLKMGNASIGRVESYVTWSDSNDIGFKVKVKSAEPDVPYNVELYKNGKFKDRQTITYTQEEVDQEMSKLVRFELSLSDTKNITSLDLFRVFRVKVLSLEE